MSRLSTKDILNMNLEEGNTRTRKSTEYSEKESKKSNLALNLESVYTQEEASDFFDDHLVSKLRGALAAGVTVNAVLEARNEKDFDEE